MTLDKLAVRAKVDERCLEMLIKKVEPKLIQSRLRFPHYIKVLFDQDGDLNWLVWELVKKYDQKEGGFIGFLNSNIQFLVKSEYRKWKKFNTRGIKICKENTRVYREKVNEHEIKQMANREAFYRGYNELMRYLSEKAKRIFKERVNPSRKTIDISIRAAFERGGSDSPVRLRWKHIAKSLGIPYVKVINIVNQEIIPKGNVIFRKYGFRSPYEYRDGIPQKMKQFSSNFPSQADH